MKDIKEQIAVAIEACYAITDWLNAHPEIAIEIPSQIDHILSEATGETVGEHTPQVSWKFPEMIDWIKEGNAGRG